MYQSQKRSLVGEHFQEERSGLPDEGKTLGKDSGVSIPELDVVGACGACVQTNRARDHKGRGFRFGLTDAFRGGGAAFSPMQEFVRLCCAQHKPIYVAVKFMWRSVSVPAEHAGIRLNKRHIIWITDSTETPSDLGCCATFSSGARDCLCHTRLMLWLSSPDRLLRRYLSYRWKHGRATRGWY